MITKHNIDNIQCDRLLKFEPISSRTYTPSVLSVASSAGVFHWSVTGKRFYDFTSGVLVTNLGHNPVSWLERFRNYMHWPSNEPPVVLNGYIKAIPFNCYNAVTVNELDACERLISSLNSSDYGQRLEQVSWAASGSEAVHKSLQTSLSQHPDRQMILATRHGFHGKKGLANIVTGSEQDTHRDPRVRFISFPMHECRDVSTRNDSFSVVNYQQELETLYTQYGQQIGTLITEPYLGGGGSYHPHVDYLRCLQDFCRKYDITFILDEVQSNFYRTSSLYAFEHYQLEPDIVVLGKGLGNGVPVAAAVGRRDLFQAMTYGETSDTWSGNPLSCSAVLATLDEFQSHKFSTSLPKVSHQLESLLIQLSNYPFVAHVRGEHGGMVWGIEMQDWHGRSASDWANHFVHQCQLGTDDYSEGVHLLGPLAKKVIRIAPPLTITSEQIEEAMRVVRSAADRMVNNLDSTS